MMRFTRFLGIFFTLVAMFSITLHPVLATGSDGCVHGNGTLEKARRSPGHYSKIIVSGVFTIDIRQQAVYTMEILCDSNLLPRISTQVSGGTLTIDTNGSLCPRLPINIRIGLPTLRTLHASGADQISISGLKSKGFFLIADGNNDIRISGEVGEFRAGLAGAGEVDAAQLVADEVDITSSGAVDARVHAKGRIKARIDGVGDIRYTGKPDEVIYSGNGIGELRQE